MEAKILFVVCAQALLSQCAVSQCIGRGQVLGPGLAAPYGLGYDGLTYGAGCGVASTGGGFPVTSISPIAPTGLTVISENTIEGILTVGGEVPFLGSVAIEGVLPTVGVGAISYGCGGNAIGMASESPIATGIVGAGSAYGPFLAAGPAYGPAYGSGLAAGPGFAPGLGFNGYPGAGCGCGCGL